MYILYLNRDMRVGILNLYSCNKSFVISLFPVLQNSSMFITLAYFIVSTLVFSYPPSSFQSVDSISFIIEWNNHIIKELQLTCKRFCRNLETMAESRIRESWIARSGRSEFCALSTSGFCVFLLESCRA